MYIIFLQINIFYSIFYSIPLGYNLGINNSPIEQVPRFNYLRVQISSKRNLKEEVKIIKINKK